MTPGTFLDPVAIAIVLGGTAIVTILRTPARDLVRALAALSVLPRRHFTADDLFERISAQARIARNHGALALDRSLIADADVAAAFSAIVDGDDGAAIREELERRLRARAERHRVAADCWAAMADTAPAMGMVGTLIGLVAMFARMTDPKAIGAAMAVALLATLYGALVANLVALPIAARLRAAARAETAARLRLVAPLVALADREAPRPVHFPPARAGTEGVAS